MDRQTYLKELWKVAEAEIGTEEPESVKYFEATDYDSPSGHDPYCAAFVNWCLAKIDIRGTRNAAAISFRDWGRKVPEGTIGAIVVWEWDSGGHHVNFYHGGGGYLGGNQTSAHEVCLEGINMDYSIAWRLPMGVQ